MRGARISTLTLAAALAAAVAGCSKSEQAQGPVACLEGPGVYLEALSAAPAEVRLDGETPISDCLPAGQDGGELAQVGSAMVTAATRLNQEAREDPGGRPAVELGYLVGAAEGAAEDTAGIHQDLILRLNAAASFDPSGQPSPAFERDFARGREAGADTG